MVITHHTIIIYYILSKPIETNHTQYDVYYKVIKLQIGFMIYGP